MSVKKQVFFIHGGESYSDYNAYLEHLRTVSIEDPLAERPKRWKYTLQDELGEAYEVFLPSMPNSQNAKYEEWKIWFERHFTFLHDGVVLIGHSQGGAFLAKYLSENTMPVRVRAAFLVAAPLMREDFGGEDGGDFLPDPQKLAQGLGVASDVFILHSADDPIVPVAHAEQYRETLPEAHVVLFKDKGHFLLETFPELIEQIRSLDENRE